MKFYFKLEDIKYAKITYHDLGEKSCTIRVAIKKIDEFQIMACAKFEEGLHIIVPQDITLSIVCYDGLYRTKTKLKRIDNEEPYTFIFLEVPQGIEYEQNREYFRVLVGYESTYTLTFNGSIHKYTAKTIDISANGVSIYLPSHIISENNSELSICINNKVINTKVRYVRSERYNDGYKISFTYTKISESDRDFISQVCLQKQLEERRNSLR